MRLARLGLLLVVLAPAARALVVPQTAFAPPPEAAPLEERLAEPWRWRAVEAPRASDARFLQVRPWVDGQLIAVDSEGLSVYDGWSWRRMPGSEAFQKVDLEQIEPLGGGIVALMGQKVAVVDGQGRYQDRVLVDRPHRTTRFVHLPDGRLAFGAGDAIHALSAPDLGTLQTWLGAPEGAKRFTALTVDSGGRMWCATDAGIYVREGERWVAPPAEMDNPCGIQQAFALEDQVHFLPASIDDLTPAATWDGTTLRGFHDATRPVVVGEVAVTPDGELVMSVDTHMLVVYRDGAWVDVQPPLSMIERIRSVCVTPQQRLAMVTSSGRLWICDLASRRWEAHDPSDQNINPMVASIAPSPTRGGLWIGTHSGLGRWDGTRFTDIHLRAGATGVPLRHVTGLAEDARGRLWVGSGSGFRGALSLDGDEWTLHDGADEVGPRYVHVIRRIDGDLWFALLGDDDGPLPWEAGGAVRLRGDRYERFEVEGGGTLPRTYDVVRTPDGRLLAGTSNHVWELAEGRWRPLHLPVLSRLTAWALHPTDDGGLWIGLGLNEEGLLRVEPDGEELLLQTGGWLHAAAGSFSRTTDDRLWFASVSGLFLVDGRDCHEISGRLPARNFWPLEADGRGGLWLGTLGSGLVHYVPDDVEPPRVIDVQSARRVQDGHWIVRFKAADRWNVTLPEQLRFRLTLDGEVLTTPGEWSGELQSHEVDLGVLPWGDHDLRYQAVDGLGNSSEPSVETLSVEPPIWLRPPLLLSQAAVLVAACWIFTSARARRLEQGAARRAQREMAERLSVLARKLLSSQEDERRTFSRDLHDDLGQLLTAVSFDLQRADRSEGDDSHDAIRRGLATTRTALDRVRELSSLLRPPVLDDLGLEQAVNSLFEEFTTRSGVDVQAELDLGQAPLPDLLAGQVYRIIQEALTNVQRHAEAATAFVTLKVRPARLDLAVSDDGKGFDVERVPLANRFGLLGMRERAELLGGSFALESAVGSGTSIRVSIPLEGTGSIQLGSSRDA